MKTLLISTDFSPCAAHAAAYGYNLAKQIKANVVLANAITIPAEIPQPGMVFWQADDGDQAMDYSTDELQKLKASLEQTDYSEMFRPIVTYVSEWGRLTDVINKVSGKNIDMIVIGKHGSDGLSTFLMGNHCSNLIDTASKPLLIVPAEAPLKQIKKIAFATDFKHVAKDVQSIYKLIDFARLMNADILLAHIYTDNNHSRALQLMIDQLMKELSNKANYPHIYYRAITNGNTEKGLDWLCEHGQIDMLATNHGPYSFINDLLNLSHTQKMAAHISIPLLVYQAGN
jgi:nucleotide-binding universal stress UspA family protein